VKAALVTAALLASASLVHADSVPNRARALAERGRAAHDARDYAAAIAAFTEAYALAPAPGLLFNLAQAYRLRGNCDDAVLMYRRFLATGPADDARLLAESHLSTVERCQAAQYVAQGPQIPEPRTMPAPLRLTKAETPARAPKRTGEKVGLGLVVTGGATLLLAGYYGLESHQAENEVERRYANGEKWRNLADRAAEGDRASTIAKISLGVGAAAIAAGATVLVIDHRKHRKTLRIEPVSGGARIGMSWGF
jgi:tetratricopeptide (TPR) repeat protein